MKEGDYGLRLFWQIERLPELFGSMCRVCHILDGNAAIEQTFTDSPPGEPLTAERRARSLVEKKTVINLLEAFAVAVKHYLRGEDGIYYRFVILQFIHCRPS